MNKILITAFEPFGGDAQNASLEAVKMLPDEIRGVHIEKLTLPVVFGRAAELTVEKAINIGADAIICVGQAGGRDKITPEKQAFNLRQARIPDNAGAKPENERICPFGCDVETSTVNVEKMAEAILAVGTPSAVSEDAGRYVCNDLLYSVLHRFSADAKKCVFIHVPYFDTQSTDKPTMPLADIARGLAAAVESVIREDEVDYGLLARQLDSLCEGVTNAVSNMANAAALIYDSLPRLNWAGFYTLNGEVLELGPFCGRPACVRIPMGRGVCGTAAERCECITVPDVHLFPGHIACDSASSSEIVVPIFKDGTVWGVLDIDSPVKDRFTEADTRGICALARVIEKHV